MDISEFIDATQLVLKKGDTRLAKDLEKVAKQSGHPLYYLWLALMYESNEELIKQEYERRDKFHETRVGVFQSNILENIDCTDAIKDGVSTSHYYGLCHK